MKLDYKRTILIGFAFLSICAFWQMYNNVVPLILTNTFFFNETVSGAIMAADNVLALILLPLFGNLSDKCKWKMGKRKPFILVGTILAVCFMMLLPLLDDSYFDAPNTIKLVFFVCALGGLLFSMGIYRSPAVALMPDVTPKPLRSMGNAVINLMGATGGIIYLIITAVLYSASRTKGMIHVSYFLLFAIVAGIMIIALIVLMLKVDEPEWSKAATVVENIHELQANTNQAINLSTENSLNEMKDIISDEEAGIDQKGEESTVKVSEKMSPEVKRSLMFLMISISLWFIGYNAIETWFTTFAQKEWSMSLGEASRCLTVGSVGAIISYIPCGKLAEKIGRKLVIMLGVGLLTLSFLAGFIFTISMDEFSPLFLVLFLTVGMGWAAISVNSFPMVVEMCSVNELGKYTGLYYVASMASQTVTPIIAGWLLRYVGYWTLFLYSTVAVSLALNTMLLVQHGDSKFQAKRGLEVFDIE